MAETIDNPETGEPMRNLVPEESTVVFDPASGEVIRGPIAPERMVELYAVAMKQADRFRDMAAKLEFDMLQYMDEQGATAIPHERYNVEVTQANSYDRTKFTPLLEIFNEADLGKCYQPERTETKLVTTPAAWSTPQVKVAAKRYGDKALAIVEGAMMMGPRRFKVSVIEPVDN